MVLGGKGALFREVSSVQECPHRERGSTIVYIISLCANSNRISHISGKKSKEYDYTDHGMCEQQRS